MRGTRRPGSGSRGARLLQWVERLFVVGGAAALVWCVFIVADAYIVQRQAHETLKSMAPAKAPPSRSSNAPSGSVARGTPLAELSIPRVGLSAVVLHGSDAHTLRQGLGHIESTPLPGESGNVAIAGHRDSFFRPLQNVQVGDDILLDTPLERVHYRVSSLRVVNSYEVSVIRPTMDAVLTLVTCYPFWFIGHAPDRFVVRAIRVGGPADATSRSAALKSSGPNRESVVDGARESNDAGTTPSKGATASRAAAPQSREARADSRASSLVNGPIPSDSIAFAVRGANDDAGGVREAVAHLRLTYNARRARHSETGADELMTFNFCEVAVAVDRATATCDAAPKPPESLPSPIWTFSLGRIGGEWTIMSVGR